MSLPIELKLEKKSYLSALQVRCFFMKTLHSLNILQYFANAPSNSVYLTSSFSSASVSDASLKVKACENDGNI